MANELKLDIFLPENRAAKIWRYLDLAKFLSLVNSKSLYFARADRLGDPFEGSITPGSIEDFGRLAKDSDYVRRIREYTRRLREWSYLSCWHLSEVESAALWSLYSRPPGGVAVQSTVERLLNCVPEKVSIEGEFICIQDISQVHYIDYRQKNPDMNSSVGPLICKRESFQHEREVRAILQFIPTNGNAINLAAAAGGSGKFLQVSLENLIERVYVDPASEDWFLDIIQSVIEKFDVNLTCHRSDLNETPFF